MLLPALILAVWLGLVVAQTVTAWLAYSRWIRVRQRPGAALPMNGALLRAVESNRENWSTNGWRESFVIGRLMWTGEHRRIGDAKLTRRVFAMRANALCVFAFLAMIMAGVVNT